MPETNGLNQVLNGMFAAEDGESGDDVAGSEDSRPDDVASPEEEFEEPSSAQGAGAEKYERVESSDRDYVENGPIDERLTEDGGKEDMFVDCPDELIVFDNRDALTTIKETKQSSEDNDEMKEACVYELDNGIYNEVIMHSPKEYKDENESLLKEFSKLHHKLRALSYQQPLNYEIEENLEIRKNFSMHDMVNECSKLVKNALDEKLRMEEEFKELQSSIIVKDQEIKYLHEKVSELSVSQNVVLSFFGSQNQSFSVSSNSSVEVQYGLQSIDDSINRLLASLAMTVNAEGLSGESITARLLFVEQNVSQIIGNYQYLLSEIDLLRQSLTEVSSDFNAEENFWTTTAVARSILLELKRKEVGFGQHVSNLEEEIKKINADVEKLKVELEQEKTKYANTKEKLSMAVTKGKGLVQQRDLLKQALAEKTGELEKCLAEIEKKTRAQEAVDLIKEELLRTENLVASLQETISQRDCTLSKCEEILYQTNVNHELESANIMERIRCLVDEKNTMTGVMIEFKKLGYILSSVDFPENVSSSDLESRVGWLVESYLLTKGEVGKLKDEIARSNEVARDEIEHLANSLLAETQEKLFIQEKLEGLNHNYQEIVEKESQLSMEKDRIVTLLLEASGTAVGQEEDDRPGSDMGSLIDRSFVKIKERISASYESSGLGADLFERMQTPLYITNQELVLCEELLEEESREFQVLKDKKSVIEKDLERSDAKTSLLREKLSMAVKKGKGLVQDKENLKKLLDEKTVEIEKLNITLQQQESVVDDFKNQISKLSMDMKLIPKLEADLVRMNDQKDQLEQFLLESNNLIQKVMESIDGFILPVDVTLEEPVDKVLWLLRYVNECEEAKTLVEQERNTLKLEFDSLSNKLSEAHAAKSSLEELLSTAENNISRLGEEKRELAEICANRKSFEDAFIEAESKISILIDEKSSLEEALSAAENSISQLGEEKRKLAEICADRKSLEDVFSEAENKISVLINEKISLEEALSAAENSISQLSKEKKELAEICATRKSLEDALLEAENKISVLINEKVDAQLSKAAAETQLEKVKDEVSGQTTRLAEAYRTINSLEDTLSHLETNVSLLSKENNDAQVDRNNLEDEMKKLKEEAESQASKFLDAASTIKSLEERLSKLLGEKKNAEEEISILKEETESQASKSLRMISTVRSLEDNVSKLVGEKKNAEEEISILKTEAESQVSKLFDAASAIRSLEDNLLKLVGEKKNAEEEISLLNSKLSACMEEMAGLGGSLQSRSLELSSHLNNLQLLLKDETLSSLLRRSFEVKFQSLRDMDFLLRDINGHLVQMGSESLPSSSGIEEDSCGDQFSAVFDNVANVEMDKGDDNSEADDGFESYFMRTVEGIHSRNRTLADKVQGSSTSMDKFFAAVLKNLQATRDEVVHKLDQVRSLEQKVNDLDTSREAQELKIASLEYGVKVLFSACTVTARELENEAENSHVELSSSPELEKWTNLLSEVRGDTVPIIHLHEISTDTKPAEDLLMAAQKICALTRWLEGERNASADAIQALKNKMIESKATAENIIKERDLFQARISKLETDLVVLQSSHREMSFKVEDYQAKETILSDQEAEISSLRKSLAMKEKEAEDALFVASQVKSLCDEINDLEIPIAGLNMGDTEFHDSDRLKKLFYVIDAVTSMQRQMNALTEDKEKLQSIVEKQTHQIENLEEELQERGKEKEELEKLKNEMFEVELGMENIIHKFGGNTLVGNHKSAGMRDILSVLEKLVTTTMLEYGNTESRSQELVVKLLGSQKVVDELSAKVKLLEASNQGRSYSSNCVEERSISEAPPFPAQSMITELEDVELLGKKAVGQASSATHARSLRKGSNDHLVINIDPESDRLMKNEESDEDKGKIFKSLSTSGLIPRQGKHLADRIDGYWVSGDRALMSRPRIRLGLIAYWLLLHIWLLGTIL